MSLNINIKKDLNNNMYLAEYKLDNEVWEKQIDSKELMIEIKSNVNELQFDTPVSFYTIDVEVTEDNKEFDVNLSKFRYYKKDEDFKEIETRTCKRKETALEIINDWYRDYKSDILNNKVDIINEIKSIELKDRKKDLDDILGEAFSKSSKSIEKNNKRKNIER